MEENPRASKTLRKCFVGNVEGRNPDPTTKERIKMKTEMYKNYEIKIWEQEPNVSYEYAFSSDNPPNVDNIKGSHGYEVFNLKGKSIYKDTWDMWDEQACIDNAYQEIDADLEVNDD